MVKQFENVDIPGLKIDGRGSGSFRLRWSQSQIGLYELLRVLTPGSFRVSLEVGWKQTAQDSALLLNVRLCHRADGLAAEALTLSFEK
jgi:hypothetical protein